MLDEKESARLLAEVEAAGDANQNTLFPRTKSALLNTKVLLTLLVASLTFNCLQLYLQTGQIVSKGSPSPFAGLTRSRTEPLMLLTPYSSENHTLQTQLWHDINIDAGVVALSDGFVQERNTRIAQRFPWDSSKGIYVLNGFHNLHCLKIIYLGLNEFRSGIPQSRKWEHLSHCMDTLRRQIMCDADDTPRATDRREAAVSGVGQHRQCRDWSAFENWAKQHTACYRRPESPQDEKGIARYKHCPEDSGYVINENYVPTEPIISGLPAENIVTLDDLI